MSDIKTKYPSADTVAIGITLASLASDTSLLLGRESDLVDNRTNLDLDHLVSGQITVGTSPLVSTAIEVWAYAPTKIVAGTPTYPDVLDGTDSVETMTSANVKSSALRLLWSTAVDTNSDRPYYMPPTSIAQAFGGMPPVWGLFVTQSTTAALHATAGNHFLHYQRQQAQTV